MSAEAISRSIPRFGPVRVRVTTAERVKMAEDETRCRELLVELYRARFETISRACGGSASPRFERIASRWGMSVFRETIV